MEVSEKEERVRDRKLFFKKEIVSETISSLWRNMAIQGHEVQSYPNRFNPKRSSLRFIIINQVLKKSKTEFWKQQEKNESSHKWELSMFLSRNLAGQERVGWYIQNSQRKNPAKQEYFTQLSCPSEVKES